MNALTLKALRGSIRKWRLIASGKGVDNGPHNCPLCQRFGSNMCRIEKTEERCPVRIIHEGCARSPFGKWIDHQWGDHEKRERPFRALCPTCKKIALEEVRFLESLLPKKEDRHE